MTVLIAVTIAAIVQVGLTTILTTNHYKKQEDQNDTSPLLSHEVSYMLNIMSQLLNMVDHVILTLAVDTFMKKSSGESRRGSRWYYYTKGFCKLFSINDWSWTCNWCMSFFALLLRWAAISLCVSIALVPPMLLTASMHNNKTIHPYTDGEGDQTIAKASLSLHWLSHAYNCITQLAMLTATLIVMGYWLEMREKLAETKVSLPDKVEKQDYTEYAIETFCKLVEEYHTIGDSVAEIQEIFQAWFVIKWIVYFIDITIHSTYIVQNITDRLSLVDDILPFTFILLHLVYDFISFITIYVFGALMNSYHKEYHTDLKKNKGRVFPIS